MNYRQRIFSYIEAELCHHQENIAELEALKTDLIEGSLGSGSIVRVRTSATNSIPRPVERLVIGLDENVRVQQLEKIVKAVTKICNRLVADKKTFVEIHYWKGKPIEHVTTKLGCNKGEVTRWRKQILIAIALELGLLSVHDAEI